MQGWSLTTASSPCTAACSVQACRAAACVLAPCCDGCSRQLPSACSSPEEHAEQTGHPGACPLTPWPPQDLLAAGITGLQKAINRFDPTRGFKFSTYSHWWIRQTIQRTVIQHGRVIRCAPWAQTQVAYAHTIH